MAENTIKIVKILDKNNLILGYPATITDAIIDLNRNKDLPTVLTELYAKLDAEDITLTSTGNLTYSLNVNGTSVGTINIPLDTFLDSVTYDTTNKALNFTFNTDSGKTAINVSIADLVDTYTADGTTLQLSSGLFSVKSGVFASAAQGTKADSALQSIAKGTDGSYVTTSIGTKSNNSQTVGVSVTTHDVETATSSENGLAVAADVKDYVDSQVSTKNVSASSTTPNQLTLSASGNAVTGSVTTATVSNSSANALSASSTTGLLTGAAISTINTSVNNKISTAINALDGTPSDTGTNVTVGVTLADGVVTAVSVDETYATITAGTGTGSAATLTVSETNNGGLVKGTDITKVVNYVNEKVSGASSAASSAILALDANVTSTGGSNISVGLTEVDGVVTAVTVSETHAAVTSSATALSSGNGLLYGSDVAKIKTYIDGKTSAAITSAGTAADNKIAALDATATSTNGTNVNITVTEADGKLTGATVSETYATVSSSGTGTDAAVSITTPAGLVTGSDLSTIVDYIDEKVSGASTDASEAIASLDSSVTSTGGTNVTVTVTEVDGKLTASTVSEKYATVSNALAISGNTTGLINGSDVTKIKAYIDDSTIVASPVNNRTYPDISSYFTT